MNTLASSLSSLAFLAVFGFSLVLPGCTSEIIGEGADGPGRGITDEPAGTGTGTADDAPAEIQALFAPPESDSVTPGTLKGVWAKDAYGVESRLAITKSSVTVARRCTGSAGIVHVTAQARVGSSTITLLESKSANLGSAYSSSCAHLALEVAEWRLCDDSGYDYNCVKVEGTTLSGLSTMFSGQYDSWIKLSD